MSVEGYYGMIVKKQTDNYIDSFFTTEKGFWLEVAFKRFSSYSGNAIRVERGSDNTTLDIDYNGNQLDTSAIEIFCSGTTGKVVRIYDQFPNLVAGYQGYVENIYANAPTIYTGGALVTDPDTGVVTPRYTSASSEELTAGFTNYIFDSTTFISTHHTLTAQTSGIVCLPAGSGAADFVFHTINNASGSTYQLNIVNRDNTGSPNVIIASKTGESTGVSRLCSGVLRSGLQNIRLDGVTEQTNTTIQTASIIMDNIRLGRVRSLDSLYYDGYIGIGAAVLADKSTDQSEIETLINNDYNIY
jgi:hypothetical protein